MTNAQEGAYFPSIASYNAAVDVGSDYPADDSEAVGFLVELDAETPDGRPLVLDYATFLPGGKDGDPATRGTVVALRGAHDLVILARDVSREAATALMDYRRGNAATATRLIHERNNVRRAK